MIWYKYIKYAATTILASICFIETPVDELIMADHNIQSLHTLPVELIYRIMDNLDAEALLISFRNVCACINTIMDTYEPYQVYFILIFSRKEDMTNYMFDILFDRLSQIQLFEFHLEIEQATILFSWAKNK
jgi:hypothetical protein